MAFRILCYIWFLFKKRMKPAYLILLLVLVIGCKNTTENEEEKVDVTSENKEKAPVLFELKPTESTKVYFTNTVNENMQENYLSYEFMYNGSVLAAGDINNDGLPDLYFAGNSSDDKLFLNKGNFEFEDITNSSGLAGLQGWSTGVTMIDINSDGWLDIYVCRSGPSADITKRTNRLYINNKDNTFTEAAADYGLASQDYSVQSAFFDYDKDGDLDMYLLNHPDPGFKAKALPEHIKDIENGTIQSDRFFENIDGKYVERSKEANLVNFGYRHGIAVGDLNEDGYPDLYISSDFEEPDLLLINNKRKGFENRIDDYMNHISFNSMGNDMVDINNDGLLDLFIVDMAPSDHFRSKAYMKSMDVDKFRALESNGYHSQYMFNTLQLNRGNNTFSEVAQYSGIAKTDWSWAPLFFDMDLDGYKDLYITNGIKENFLFRDIQKNVNEKQQNGGGIQLGDLLEIVPSDITANIFYKNVDGVKFKDMSSEWSSNNFFNSNGAVTADLDNDGDLDLITNNMENNASIYENKVTDVSDNNYVKIKLKGTGNNTQAVGAKVKVIGSDQNQIQELYFSKGYLSSNDSPLFFGVGKDEQVNVTVSWPNGKWSSISGAQVNQTLEFDISEAVDPISGEEILTTAIFDINNTSGLNYEHKEDTYDEYTVQILLPHSQSTTGPGFAKADINNDGLEDIFIGGAAGSEAALFTQTLSGKFRRISGPWAGDKAMEDTGVLWVDLNEDGLLDLYVVSGGAHVSEGDPSFSDRVYMNLGGSKFVKNTDLIPDSAQSGKTVLASDIDGDGDQDLFVGGRIIPDKYPLAAGAYMLINNNGSFQKRDFPTDSMISDAIFTDYDNDGDQDLIAVGEWSSIMVYENNAGSFDAATVAGLSDQIGLWFSIDQEDIDGDGDMDYFVGNLGLNSKFKAKGKKEFHVYCEDFDENGTYDLVLSSTYKGKLVPTRGRECSSQQMPFIQEKFGDYTSFANASLSDIYGEKLNTAFHRQATTLASLYIENLGNGQFKTSELPWQAQLAPLSDFDFIDLDSDGIKEVVCVGNLYNVEVETPRYDASTGAVLRLENGVWKGLDSSSTGIYATGDARGVTHIKTREKNMLFVFNSNGPVQVFDFPN